MKNLILFGAMLFTAVACLSDSQNNDDFSSKLNFESAHTDAYDGVIENGEIISQFDLDFIVIDEINTQLQFVVGQLNGIYGGADLSKTKIEISSKTALENGKFLIRYKASLLIAWPKELEPSDYILYLPKQGDYEFLDEALKKHGETSGCLDYFAHDVNIGSFWYYYRPDTRYCSISSGDEEFMGPAVMTLTYSAENTDGKFPEYYKVWEDGKLVTTMIFGKNEHDGQEYDAGVQAYKQMYAKLIARFGEPTFSSIKLKPGTYPSLEQPELKLSFKTSNGPLEVNLFLVDGIMFAPVDFAEKYNKLTLDSDYVSYSGHSGLGANIRALAQMGEFREGQYQIFLINGCDTFAYVDDSLKTAHSLVNQGEKEDKYLDIIVNAMPSYFSMNANSNMAIVDALVNQKDTYQQILSRFDSNQRAIVTGEEDNSWPEAF